jgi:hypothetical protein
MAGCFFAASNALTSSAIARSVPVDARPNAPNIINLRETPMGLARVTIGTNALKGLQELPKRQLTTLPRSLSAKRKTAGH